MGHSIGDGIIVAALAAAFVAYIYFKHLERRRRLEILHQERLAAMDKGIPLPELPIDPPGSSRPAEPQMFLIHGITWLALGAGAMIVLRLIAPGWSYTPFPVWPFPLPVMLLGLGLVLYALLAGRTR